MFVAHDGITIWGFGHTDTEAIMDAKEWSGGGFDTDRPDCSVDECGPRLWESREKLTDPSSGWSVGSDGVVELDALPVIREGDYYQSHEGGGWTLYRVRSGEVVSTTTDADAGTHAAAGDHFADDKPNWDALDEVATDAEKALLIEQEPDYMGESDEEYRNKLETADVYFAG